MTHLKIIINMMLLLTITACNNNGKKADAYGNFETDEIIVSAETQGKIIWMNLQEGQNVKTDEIILIIDTTTLYLQLEQLTAKSNAIETQIQTINSQIALHQAQLNTLFNEKNRVTQLLEGNAATKKQLDDIEANITVTQKQIQIVESQKSTIINELIALKKQKELQQHQINKCYVKSPINGTILEKYVQLGELSNAGKALFSVADLSFIYLRAYISGNQLSSIKLNQNVSIKIDTLNKQFTTLEGQITWISSQTEFTPKIIQTKEDRINMVYAIKVKVNNNGRLKIGMPGEIIFNNLNN
jgi:HlyD family secretion protein